MALKFLQATDERTNIYEETNIVTSPSREVTAFASGGLMNWQTKLTSYTTSFRSESK